MISLWIILGQYHGTKLYGCEVCAVLVVTVFGLAVYVRGAGSWELTLSCINQIKGSRIKGVGGVRSIGGWGVDGRSTTTCGRYGYQTNPFCSPQKVCKT